MVAHTTKGPRALSVTPCFKMTTPQALSQSSFTPYDVLEANSLSFFKKNYLIRG